MRPLPLLMVLLVAGAAAPAATPAQAQRLLSLDEARISAARRCSRR